MKRSLIIVLILVIVLGVLGYFSYRHVFLKEKVNIFSLVPENALLVYESNHIGRDWENLQTQEVWKSIEDIPSFSKAKNDIAILDSLLGSGGFYSFFKGRPFLASMHTISKDEFDFLYITELPHIADQKKMDQIIDQLNGDKPLNVQTRHFNGFTITELQQKRSKKAFTYILYRNYLIGSFATILVEDVVRNINADFTTGFLTKKKAADKLSNIDTDSGKLYVNLQNLGEFFSIFSSGRGINSNIINNFGEVALLEINFKEGDLLLNGFSDAGNSSYNTWLETFEGLAPKSLEMANVIPDRTAFFHHITFDNAQKWNQNLTRYWEAGNPQLLEERDKLIDDLGVNPDDLFPYVGTEIGLATLESLELTDPDKLAYIHTSNQEEALIYLENIAFQASNIADDTVFKEEYSGITIIQIASEQFPSKLFGPLFQGFESSFYMPYKEYIIIGSSVEVLKGLLEDIEREDTWGKSVKYNQFLAETLKESSYSMTINASRVWNIFLNNLSPKWKDFMKNNSRALKSLELLEFQFSNIENDFYTSITYSHNNAAELRKDSQRLQNLHNVYLENKIISKPFIVNNPAKGNREVIVQDSAQYIYLISSEGQVLWKDSIDGQIVGDVTQIDFYNNGNLQFLIATDKSLYVIDRKGEYVPGFPLTPGYMVDQIRAIDYDKSKNYRFLVADREGNIYMYDKNGKNLEGWTPRSMEYKLSFPPAHLRVRAKDIIFALEERGILKAATRRGEFYPGFPVSFEDKVISPLFLEIGPNFDQTKFTGVTVNGMIIQGNFEGEILRRSQLYKPSAATSFKLIPSSSGKSFLILRQDLRRVAILNRNGEVLFEKDYLSSEEMDAQYFSFGTERNFIAITDRSQEFTYLYDITGKLINNQPLESNNQIEMIYSESDAKYYVYSVYGSEFSLDFF